MISHAHNHEHEEIARLRLPRWSDMGQALAGWTP